MGLEQVILAVTEAGDYPGIGKPSQPHQLPSKAGHKPNHALQLLSLYPKYSNNM